MKVNLFTDGEDLELSQLVALVAKAQEFEAPDNAIVGYDTEDGNVFIEWYE